jgi:hypothetical protein
LICRPYLFAVSTWWDGREVTIATIGSSRTARNLDETRLGRLAIVSATGYPVRERAVWAAYGPAGIPRPSSAGTDEAHRSKRI